MKTVMCFGTFDLLHIGHLSYLQQAKKYGDYLLVVIARDATKKKQKKHILFNELERLRLLQSLKIVDKAVLGNHNDHLKIILTKKPDVICLGYDHPIIKKDLAKKLALWGYNPIIIRLKPYHPSSQKSGILKAKILKSV